MKPFHVIPFLFFAGMIAFIDIVPAEDAFITFRYAENMAQGEGLVYNPGQRVYGSTEVLFAVILAGCGYVGLNVPASAVAIGYVSIALSIALVLYVFRKQRTTAVLASSLLALSPLVIHASSGFGMPLAGLLLAGAFTFRTRVSYLLFALASMIRPEASILFLWFVYRDRSNAFWFVAPFGIFLALVTWYYGSPIPNTLYAKMRLSSTGADATAVFSLFCLGMVFMWKRLPKDAIPLIVFGFLYLLIAQYQNIGFRYQFWTLPAFMVIAPFKARYSYLIALALAGMFYVSTIRGSDTIFDERKDVGEALAGQKGTMLTTEAGWLPYFSGWTAYDAFGLYDPRIAREGLTFEYMQELDPDVIVSRAKGTLGPHGYVLSPSGDKQWDAMVSTIDRYAASRGYWASPLGRKTDLMIYYAKSYKTAEVMNQAIKRSMK